MEPLDTDILDSFALWEFGDLNFASYNQDRSSGSNQAIRMNDGVLIHQTSEIQFFPPTQPPLQAITTSARPQPPDRKILPSIQCSSPSSQYLVQQKSFISPTVMGKASKFLGIPLSPIEVKLRSKGANNSSSLRSRGRSRVKTANIDIPNESLSSISPNGKQRITMYNMQTLENPEEVASIISHNLGFVVTTTYPKPWTEKEDRILLNAVESQTGPPYDWNLIASRFLAGSRTGIQCKNRYRRVSKGRKVRRNWTPEEDNKILNLKSAGFTWKAIAEQCPHRSYNQIRSRYNDHLEPSLIKTPWTEAEDIILVEEQSRIGNKWTQIAQKLPGRSTNQVKGRWYLQHQELRSRKQIKSPKVKQFELHTWTLQEPTLAIKQGPTLASKSPTVKRKRSDSPKPNELRTPWTVAEDNILTQEQGRLGNKWTQISKLLPGRSSRQVKGRWYRKQKSRKTNQLDQSEGNSTNKA